MKIRRHQALDVESALEVSVISNSNYFLVFLVTVKFSYKKKAIKLKYLKFVMLRLLRKRLLKQRNIHLDFCFLAGGKKRFTARITITMAEYGL